MNRRGFFSALTATAAMAAVDPERLVWVPHRKLISIPAPRPMTVAGPFIVIPRMVGQESEWQCAKILESRMNQRWNTDAAFRERLQHQSPIELVNSLINCAPHQVG